MSFVLISRVRYKTPGLPYSDIYDRQTRAGIDYSKMSAATVWIIGAGALGGWFSHGLAREGIGHLKICDGDMVEPSNLPRQFFYSHQIQQNKAIALLENLKQECTGATLLEAYPMDFQNVLQKVILIGRNINLMACLVDNDKTRYDVAVWGIRLNIPVIFSAVSRTMMNGYVFVQTNQGACFWCIKPPKKNSVDEDQQCIEPGIIYIHQALMGIAVFAATHIIQGRTLPWNYYELTLDSESVVIQRQKRSDCKLCAGRGEINGQN